MILGKVEHAGVRFIITDYGEAVAELGPLSKSAAVFLSEVESHRGGVSETLARNGTTGEADTPGAHID
jgi:antitoxin (DNA-binding transcriptional repressor) of toxin-antitoxin stability system